MINQIYQQDCIDYMKTLPDDFIDLTVTDPPYTIEYSSYRTKSKLIEGDNTKKWIEPFFKELSRVVKLGSHLYCFTDFEMSADFLVEIRKYWKVRNLISIPRTIKGNGGDRIFQQQFEYVIFATRGNRTEGRKFNQTQILKPSETYLKDKRYNAKEWLYRLPDYWYWTKASEFNHDRLHPNQKNVDCLKDMIQISSNPGDLVFDPFCGSGSTLVAAKSLDRNWIGCEIDPKFVEVSEKRLGLKQSV
jgi:site-specific DNA-methyltransferase (adenine-specific)